MYHVPKLIISLQEYIGRFADSCSSAVILLEQYLKYFMYVSSKVSVFLSVIGI